ncbi:pre-rRNA-processing protein esf1 [Coemansia sp. RSA 552]|nr:pre-rRNA-processing protein esf1 [Coemansia sp. RSA 552]
MAPRDKKPTGDGPAKRGPAQKVTQDSRFAHMQEDPRFQRPRKGQTKVKVDKRFRHMVSDKDFTETTKVDRYGRVQEDNRAEAYLRNTYDFESSSSESEGSGSESEDSDSGSEGGSEESEGSEASSDEDEMVDRARGRGVASDESSDDSEDSDLSDVEWGGGAMGGGLSDIEEDPESIPRGDETKRFACVNMDWDHVRATDLYAVFVGFKPDSGSIVSVKIYPSDFGVERMAKEDTEGPPRELFGKTGEQKEEDSDAESDTEVDLVKEQVKDTEDLDQVALRKYEMEKMRYYFAVVECDTAGTAQAIYSQCDGTEFEASANFLDLRFIPDDMEFEHKPREEAVSRPEQYEPTSFTTQALQHSKVQLSWDADEPSRVKTTRRAFTQDEIDNMDFGNLLASSGSESSDEEDVARKRSLLLAGPDKDSDSEDESNDDMGDMEITFTPGLSETAAARIDIQKEEEAKARADETPIERFRRMKMEKRDKWKATKKGDSGKRQKDSDDLVSDNEIDPTLAGDTFFTLSDDESQEPAQKGGRAQGKPKGRETQAERKQRQQNDAKERAELELLLEGNEADRKHFDMKEIVKAEKSKGRKGKKRGKAAAAAAAEDDFQVNVSDPRFSALFDSHNFAIDPNNPNFKKTKAMKELLGESRKRHKTLV